MSEATPEQEKDKEMAQARKLVDELGEHWDNIQVFCTRYEGDETQTLHIGKGNVFARTGYVRHWLIKADEKSREEAREDFSE
jgi:hypothetical protein